MERKTQSCSRRGRQEGGREGVDEKKQERYLQMLNQFALERAIKSSSGFDGLPELTKKILLEIKKEQGLTYDEAYIALECAYRYLKVESNFVQVYKE